MKSYVTSLSVFVAVFLFSCQGQEQTEYVLFFQNETTEELAVSYKSALTDVLKENQVLQVSSNSEQLVGSKLEQYSAVVFSEVVFDELSQEQVIAIERYLQAGGGVISLHQTGIEKAESRKYLNRLRGALQTDYKGENPKDFQQNLALPEQDFAVRMYLKNSKTDTWQGEYDGGRLVYAKVPSAEQLTFAVGENSRDYTKAHSIFAPDESRFVKEDIITGLYEPMELDVLPNGRIIFIERRGEVTLYNPDTELLQPAGTFDVYTEWEDGLLGLAIDPNFAENGWLYFDYSPHEKSVNRISRFTMKDNLIDFSSEKILLEIPTDRGTCCHAAGAMAFDSEGNLYITMGDDTNPWVNDGMAPIDSRPGQAYGDARRSAGNTNDFRGKILRIKPEPDGTYSIPDGNLFPEGNPKARPEIYVMGVRNPFTISIDEKSGNLFWGDVGPDSGEADSLRGPRAYDEINVAKAAGNFGWPFTRGNRQAYREYDFATQESGAWFDPDNLRNESPNNTGLIELPPAQSSLVWYPYAPSPEFPWVTSGGKNPMVGPIYYSKSYEGDYSFPKFFDGKLFVFEWMRHWIYTLELDKEGNLRRAVPFMKNTEFARPMDMVFGKDGTLYMLEYGSAWFARNSNAGLSRIKYHKGNRKPIARIVADKTTGAAPLAVQFSGEESIDLDKEELSYEWTFPGYGKRGGKDVSFTYKYPGIYEVGLTVKDASGNKDYTKVKVQVGNEAPKIALNIHGNEQFYWENVPIDYSVSVSDREDGDLTSGIDSQRVSLLIDLLPQGEDIAGTEVGHQAVDALAGLSRGEILISKSDCKSCHALNTKINGPSYTEIAERYPNNKATTVKLANKVITGGNGVWGETNMSAHPQLTESQAKAMVAYILSIDEPKSETSRLPLAGHFTPEEQPLSEEGYKEHGQYILSASYTDNGAGKTEPQTVRRQVKLKAPLFFGYQADHYSNQSPDIRGGLLQSYPAGEYFTFENIDLTNVGGLSFEIRGKRTGTQAIELVLTGKNDVILGTEKIQTNDDSPQKISMSLEPPAGRQDLKLMLKSEDEEAALSFGFFYLSKAEVKSLSMK